RLSTRRLGLGDTRALRKGSGLALPAPFELGDLRAQLGNLALQLNHQRQQLLTTSRRKVSGLNHGRHYKLFVRGLQVKPLINDQRPSDSFWPWRRAGTNSARQTSSSARTAFDA